MLNNQLSLLSSKFCGKFLSDYMNDFVTSCTLWLFFFTANEKKMKAMILNNERKVIVFKHFVSNVN